MSAIGDQGSLCSAPYFDVATLFQPKSANSFLRCLSVVRQPKGMTSIGRGNLPSFETTLLSSTKATILSEAQAMIFFPKKICSSSFNHSAAGVDFIRPVDSEVELTDVIQVS